MNGIEYTPDAVREQFADNLTIDDATDEEIQTAIDLAFDRPPDIWWDAVERMYGRIADGITSAEAQIDSDGIPAAPAHEDEW